MGTWGHTFDAHDASERRPIQASDTRAEEGAGQEDGRQEDGRQEDDRETGGEETGGEEGRRTVASESSHEPVRRRRQEAGGEEGEEADAGEEGGAQGDQVQGFPGRGARQV